MLGIYGGASVIIDIRKQLQDCMGFHVVIETKKMKKVCGYLSWLSPDHSMAEVTLKSGEIYTIIDIDIKKINKR